MRSEDVKIVFEASQDAEALINNAWMEVVSELNTLAKALSKPVRKDEISRIIKASGNGDNPYAGGASRLVQSYLMIPSFKAYSKREAIEKLVDAIAEFNPKAVRDAAAAKQAVFDREESMPTGLTNGLAVPHGRTVGVTQVVGAVALVDNSENENGAIPDYETIDHSRLQLIVLSLVPEEGQNPYLQLMSFIAKAMKNDELRERLLACKTPEEMRKTLRSAG